MKSKLTEVRKLMDDSVFKGEKFTEKHKQQVLQRIENKERSGNLVPRSLSVVFSLILIISIGYLLSNVLSDGTVQQGNSGTTEQPQIGPAPPEESDGNEESEKAEDGVIELTSEELAAYEKFSEDFDNLHLKDLEPISVAKLYVWAGYNQNYEVEYELLTDREKSIMWDKEYHLAIPQGDRMTPEKAMNLFRNLDSGEFLKLEEYYGSITFRHEDGPEGLASMQMLQNEDGVWQVGFMALQ